MEFLIRFLSSILPPLFAFLGLSYFVATDKYIKKIHKRAMSIAIVLIVLAIMQDIMDFYYVNIMFKPTLRAINSACGYIILPIIIVMFCYFVDSTKKYYVEWFFIAVNTVIYITTLFAPIAFEIRDDNTFVRGPLGFACHIISFLLLFDLFYRTIKEYGRQKEYAVIPILCFVLTTGSAVLDIIINVNETMLVSYLSISTVICCVLFYIWIHRQIVNAYEESIAEQQRIKIMMSQIRPHFLYNTIATIRALCKTDSEKAANVAEKFGKYLRENLELLNSDEFIAFEKELEHTRIYAEIEMIRFENIRVEYDIKDKGYLLPALTIQPIVENAIRHGVRGRELGIVQVKAHLSDGFHEIVISDNGIGFDVANLNRDDGMHIGIANVRGRIEKLCEGTMTIESEIDKGTTVTIRIPRKEVER